VGELDPDLFGQAHAFADDVADLLQSTVTNDAPIKAEVRGGRVVVAPLDEDGGTVLLPLCINGQPVASLRVHFECSWDYEKRFLAIQESSYALLSTVIAEPILRFEYLRGEHSVARAAHIHAHGECTQLGALYAAAGVVNRANLQRLHLPVGGKRFRPCLEDVIEFLVKDLSVDGSPGWEERIEAGRERWYGLQLAATMREYQDKAVEVMRRLGYLVERSSGADRN
jgi:hypothetical protein